MTAYVTEASSRDILQRAFDATVRLVAPVSGDGEEPHATGFFYTDYSSDGFSEEQALKLWDKRLWLITNRHVVWSDDCGPTDSLEICLRDPDYTFGFEKPAPEKRVFLDATYMADNVWIPGSHDTEPPDIAAIEMVGEKLLEISDWVYRRTDVTAPSADGGIISFPRKPRFRLLTRDDCGDASTAPQVGTQVMAIGYPVGGVDEITGIPVAKSGSVATDYLGGWEGTERFLVDINQFPGSSGSPLFTAPQPALSFDPEAGRSVQVVARPSLIGIHCAGREFESDSVGLGISWSLPWAIFSVIDPELAPANLAGFNSGTA